MRTSITWGAWLALVAMGALTGGAARAQDSDAAVEPEVHAIPSCAMEDREGYMRCHSWVVTDAAGNVQTTAAPATPAGLHPADLRSAYNIHGKGSSDTVIAIVDAFHYPTAESDLNMYRKTFGLGACTRHNGCFEQVNQKGKKKNYKDSNLGWNREAALDLQMASAMCPKCRLILVEANDNHGPNLAKAVDTAARLGAHVISNSYGGKEGKTESQEPSYDHPGVAVTASSGDSGLGVQFPATSPHVIAVGGTSLRADSTTERGWTETAWAGAGSGCSDVYPKPEWQTDKGCKMRMEADVSAVASPGTGVSVYAPLGNGSSGWLVFGGTSVAAPLIGGIYGQNGGSVNYAENPYKHTKFLYDITVGSNGSCGGKYRCTAGPGYDGPTGLGTPHGDKAF